MRNAPWEKKSQQAIQQQDRMGVLPKENKKNELSYKAGVTSESCPCTNFAKLSLFSMNSSAKFRSLYKKR